uniref:Uncharacterized protein n=1 Tax=Caenorhabditis japonica TaxID=281687 RepID=A0A8R1ELX7_CAEJA
MHEEGKERSKVVGTEHVERPGPTDRHRKPHLIMHHERGGSVPLLLTGRRRAESVLFCSVQMSLIFACGAQTFACHS